MGVCFFVMFPVGTLILNVCFQQKETIHTYKIDKFLAHSHCAFNLSSQLTIYKNFFL